MKSYVTVVGYYNGSEYEKETESFINDECSAFRNKINRFKSRGFDGYRVDKVFESADFGKRTETGEFVKIERKEINFKKWVVKGILASFVIYKVVELVSLVS
jgi:hypothetical protein